MRFWYPLLASLSLVASVCSVRAEVYQPPSSPRRVVNFNAGWRFIRQDVPGAEAPGFDDARWRPVGLPHTYNETDTFDELITHSHGEQNQYTGIAWYRKHFHLPAGAATNGKVFLEFEGLKQAGWFYVNGKLAGRYENGVTPCGVDLTALVHEGSGAAGENVLAVKVDNDNAYKEQASGVGFQWMSRDFNPNYGGLNHDVELILTGKVYQTLPLYEGLKTMGVYVYPSNFSLAAKTCDITVEAQVKNEAADNQSISLTAVVVDAAGVVRATLTADPTDLVGGETEVMTVTGSLGSAHWWSPSDPYLYSVYSILTVGGQVVDVTPIKTGFRLAEFRGGAGTGGVWLNGQFIYLKGYSQRSTNEWAGLGQAYPDWMHEYNADLIKSTHANYLRWMHIAPQPVDVRAFDRAGIIEVAPAGDKERDVTGRQWEQRVEVMRDTMIYYRNHPSILFWEAGNTVIVPAHMTEMVALRKQWDPSGGRVIGARGNDDAATNTAITPIAEYFGVMMGQDPRTDQLPNAQAMFRGYSAARRDRAPLIETEDFRDEASRRFWDDYSPPHFGFKPGEKDTYHWNSETFALAAVARYHAYELNKISNPDPAHSKWAGYASIYWSDSNADGRQDSSEVARVSGKVDAVRLPKEAYYAYRVMQSETPDLHILGHWSYPAATKKTMYVVASHCDSVELWVNGRSLGKSSAPQSGYIFAFPGVGFEPGVIKAVATASGQVVASEQIETAGAPAQIKLTAHTAPGGLKADGTDVAFIDFEVCDQQGRRCPTDEARVNFTVSGPAIWRGGYDSGKLHSTNNLYLDTECGINRVAVRSVAAAGTIRVTATRQGLAPGVVEIVAR